MSESASSSARTVEGVLDFETIDVEIDEDLVTKQGRRCIDEFLNSLCLEDGDEEFIVPVFENDEDDEEVEEQMNAEEVEAQQMEEEQVDAADEEAENQSVPEFNGATHDPNVKWNRMIPQEGERYESPQQLRECLTNHAIAKGYQIRYIKSANVRIHCVCASDPDKYKCPFFVRASWMSTEKSFQIKKMCGRHTCIKNFNNGKLMGPSWLARQFLKELIRQPTLKPKNIQSIVQHKLHTKLSWVRCYRARNRAMAMLEGKLGDHYARVYDYGGELGRSNPGSTIRVGVRENSEEGPTVFKRMYICFKSIKDGWKQGCRRVVGLDGAFPKGQCKGELLTAIGRDPNNQVYPIAWAVVEIESKDNWSWFLRLLESDLGLDGGRGICVISDQHKGLVEATKEVLPFVEHRQCARHIYANFRKTYSGIELRNMFWKAAKSTTEGEFKRNMGEIKEHSPGAYAYLMGKEPESWCRAFFSAGLACEAVENGMAECFNAVIVDARKKPLLTMLEEIRLYVMARTFNLKELVDKWEGNVCPAAIKKMEKWGEDLKYWYVHPSGESEFEVRNGLLSFGVNIAKRICACRLWEISGIPCVHAQASIMFTGQDPTSFISPWFSKQMYNLTYADNILPVNGSSMWQASPFTKPLPPIERTMPGRPSVKRKRHVSERDDKFSQVSSKGRNKQCGNCQQLGHNKLTCPNPYVAPDPKPQRKMGRPRVDPNLSHWAKNGRQGRRGRGGGLPRGGGGGGVPRGGSGGVPRGGGLPRGGGGGGVPRGGSGGVPRGGGGGWNRWFDRGESSNMGQTQNAEEVTGADEAEVIGADDEGLVDVAVMNDGDGLDLNDQDYIMSSIHALRESYYDDEAVMGALGITKSQLQEFGTMKKPLLAPYVEDETRVHQGPEVVAQDGGFEGAAEVAEPEMAAPGGFQGVAVVLQRRRPSERQILQKLAKKVVHPQGVGMSKDKPLDLA